MNKKKILVFSLLLILSVISIFYIYSQTKVPDKDKLTPQAPRIPEGYTEDIPINMNITPEQFNFPKELPLLITPGSKPLTKDDAIIYANRLEYNYEPEVDNDVNQGTVYIWLNSKGTLYVYSGSQKVYFVKDTPIKVTNKQLSDNEYVEVAKDFASSTFGLDKTKLEFENFIYYKGESNRGLLQETDKQNAEIIHVNLSQIPFNYPIVTLDSTKSPLYVQILKNGDVYKSEYIVLTNLKETDIVYPLKNYDEVTSNIDQAILIKIGEGYFGTSNIPSGDITYSSINIIKLVYLVDSAKSNTYQPVYLMEGKARIRGLKDEVLAKFYLPAIKYY